jgi:adenylate cyclase
VDPDVLGRFKQAGLYEAGAPNAAEREELIDHLVDRFGVELVLEAAARVPLFTVAIVLTDPLPPRLTAREVAEATGLDIEAVRLVREATGFAVADPDDRSVPASLVEDGAVIKLGFEIIGRERTLAFTRVLGANVQQIADAARAVFATSAVEDRATAVTELELSQANEVALTAWKLLPAVIEHMMLERTDGRRDVIGRIVRGDLQMAVVFVDLVGSTAWTASSDPRRHAEALARFEQAAWTQAVSNRGRLVKMIGDEAMVAADDVEDACRIATALCALAAADPDLPDARGGVGYGPVTARGGDYFGPLVNLVARLRGEASPNEVVVTAEVADELDDLRWHIKRRGSLELRGVHDPVALAAISPRADS